VNVTWPGLTLPQQKKNSDVGLKDKPEFLGRMLDLCQIIAQAEKGDFLSAQ